MTKAETIFVGRDEDGKCFCQTGLVCEECNGKCYLCIPAAEAREFLTLAQKALINFAYTLRNNDKVRCDETPYVNASNEARALLAKLPEEE